MAGGVNENSAGAVEDVPGANLFGSLAEKVFFAASVIPAAAIDAENCRDIAGYCPRIDGPGPLGEE